MVEVGEMHREGTIGEVTVVVHRKEGDPTSRTHLCDKARTRARNRIHHNRTHHKIPTVEEIKADSRPPEHSPMGLPHNQRNQQWIPWLSRRQWHT